jgi:hypothetical protein
MTEHVEHATECRDCDEPCLNGLSTCDRHTAARHKPVDEPERWSHARALGHLEQAVENVLRRNAMYDQLAESSLRDALDAVQRHCPKGRWQVVLTCSKNHTHHPVNCYTSTLTCDGDHIRKSDSDRN